MANIRIALTNGERIITTAKVSEGSARNDKLLGIFFSIMGIAISAVSMYMLHESRNDDLNAMWVIYIIAGAIIFFTGTLFEGRGRAKSNKTALIITNRRIIGETTEFFRPGAQINVDNSVSGISSVRYEKQPMDDRYGCATVAVTFPSATYKFRGIENYDEICNALRRSA